MHSHAAPLVLTFPGLSPAGLDFAHMPSAWPLKTCYQAHLHKSQIFSLQTFKEVFPNLLLITEHQGNDLFCLDWIWSPSGGCRGWGLGLQPLEGRGASVLGLWGLLL